jgi:hypothetical protein
MKRLGLLVAVVLLVVSVAASPAIAQTTPVVVVTPATGLVDGQTVSVAASDFLAVALSAGTFVPTAFECAPQFPPTSTFDLQTAVNVVEPLLEKYCVSFGEFPVTQSTATTRNVTVRRSFVSRTGETFTCGATPGDCLIVAAGASPGGVAGLASSPITFAPPTPTSKDQCKRGGWRLLVNAHGEPFKNEGRCIAFV